MDVAWLFFVHMGSIGEQGLHGYAPPLALHLSAPAVHFVVGRSDNLALSFLRYALYGCDV